MKADIHGILDCLEEPSSILQQAIRDMEEAIAQTEDELRRREEEAKQLEQAKNQVEHGYRETSRQLDVCFDSKNESLARTLVRKRLELEKRIKAVAELVSENTRKHGEISARLKDQREKLVSIREKAELFAARDCAVKSVDDEWYVSDEQVELAMLEEKKKRGAAKAA